MSWFSNVKVCSLDPQAKRLMEYGFYTHSCVCLKVSERALCFFATSLPLSVLPRALMSPYSPKGPYFELECLDHSLPVGTLFLFYSSSSFKFLCQDLSAPFHFLWSRSPFNRKGLNFDLHIAMPITLVFSQY